MRLSQQYIIEMFSIFSHFLPIKGLTIITFQGTAEIVFTDGLIWCQAPIGYALSLMLGITITKTIIITIITIQCA